MKLLKGLEIEIIISPKMIDVIENYIHLEKRLPKNDSTKSDSLDYYPTFGVGAWILLSLKNAEKTLENTKVFHYSFVTLSMLCLLYTSDAADE